MQGFQFKHGDRPLEGYTIQRAIGRGGFGEVYYAVSDSGREVALKVLTGYEQIELRGVGQCMNLKSPHLVSIFDVRHNDQDRPFVIMEHVAGPSLRELLDDAPAGLGPQKAAFFLREIAKGLTFLHDRGIVHRDLKPGNIFYEDGYVKIGDYGLSKAISASRHSGQTITVGTVHYMAPEIGQGRYDRSIDIYALGVVLFEMLTGQVPFFGASHGEILMKHLTAEPALEEVEEPFRTVIRKALCKDPAERYASVQDMVEAVFGAEHIQQSVSHFSPDSLTLVAGKAAGRIAVAGTGSSGEHAGGYAATPRIEAPTPPPGRQTGESAGDYERRMHDYGERMGRWGQEYGERMGRWGQEFGQRMQREAEQVKHRVTEALGGPAGGPSAARQPAPAGPDVLSRRQRGRLAIIACLSMAGGAGLLSAMEHGTSPMAMFAAACVLMIGAVKGAEFIQRRGYRLDDPRLGHMVAARFMVFFITVLTVFAVGALIVMSGADRPIRNLTETLSAAILAVPFLAWRRMTTPQRPKPVSPSAVLWAIGVAFIIALMLDGNPVIAATMAAGVALTAQTLFSWHPGADASVVTVGAGGTGAPWAADQAAHDVPNAQAHQDRRHAAAYERLYPYGQQALPNTLRPAPAALRLLSLFGFVIFTSIGLITLIWAGMTSRMDDETFAGALSAGISGIGLGLFALNKALKTRMRSWWSSVLKPLILLVLAFTAMTSMIVLGNVNRLGDEEMLIGVSFIVVPLMLLIVTACVPNRLVAEAFGGAVARVRPDPHLVRAGVSHKYRGVATALLSIGFIPGFPIAGLHRFYVGKPFTGLIWFFTGGFFYIGTIFDLVMLLTGQFTDDNDRPLLTWWNSSPPPPRAEVNPAGAAVAGDPMRHAAAGPGPDRQEAEVPWSPAPAAPPFEPAAMRSPGMRPGSSPSVSVSSYAANAASWSISFMGVLLLILAIAVGLSAACGLPHLIGAGMLGLDLPRELDQNLGTTDWPRMLTQLGMVVTVVLMLLAASGLMIGRRSSGGLHMVRAAAGVAGILASLAMLREAFWRVNWYEIGRLRISGHDGPATALDRVVNNTTSEPAAIAAVLLLAAITILAWPAKRNRNRELSS